MLARNEGLRLSSFDHVTISREVELVAVLYLAFRLLFTRPSSKERRHESYHLAISHRAYGLGFRWPKPPSGHLAAAGSSVAGARFLCSWEYLCDLRLEPLRALIGQSN